MENLSSSREANSGTVVILCGENQTKIWGASAAERVRRMAAATGLTMEGAVSEAQAPRLLVNSSFAFDPAWFRFMAQRPDHVLTFGGRPVLALVASGDPQKAEAVAAAMTGGAPLAQTDGLSVLAFEDGAELHNVELRKKEQPFLLPLEPANVAAIERASYYGAYKGVTDILTKYLWPELAFHITRLAARLRLSPNAVTAIGALLSIAATFAFFEGRYWLGLALGFVFMVLDTVDGKLARCTITSSKWGNIFDHGVDLIHPPFWWWAWAAGLSAYGRPIGGEAMWIALAVIFAGYVLQRVIEGVFIRLYGMHIHVWRPVDSRFRLITARRNPNVAILFFFLLAGRPDLGFFAITFWTAASLGFHLVRLLQAMAARRAGHEVASWLN